MTTNQKIAFVERAVDEMAAYAFRHLTEVIGVQSDGADRFLGSGFFCTLGGRHVVVTARHVIKEAEAAGLSGVVFGRGDGIPPGIVDGDLLLFEDTDLAFYVPDVEFPLHETKGYWPESRIEVQTSSIRRDYLILAGFPGRFSRITSLDGGAMTSESLTYGAMMRYRECDIADADRADFDRELPGYEFLPNEVLGPHEFAIHFDATPEMFLDPESSGPDEERRVEDWLKVFQEGAAMPGGRSYGPLGLSGSPIFRLGPAGPEVAWGPHLSRLVGVATRWLPEHRAVVATTAKAMLEAFQTAADGFRSSDG